MTHSAGDRRALTAVVADDEPLARELLHRMLRAQGVDVLGEAATGAELIQQCRERHPDVAFVDVQMPGLTGVEAAELLGTNGPAVVFVTAYSEHAVKAFELHATDYILKPFDDERLARALARVARRRDAETAAAAAQALDAARRQPGGTREWLFLCRGERMLVRRVGEVERLEADRKVVRVHLGKEVLTMPGPLHRIEAELDPRTFIRISRSDIVNLAAVREVQPWFAGEYVVLLASGAQVTTTRAYRDRLVQLMRRAPR